MATSELDEPVAVEPVVVLVSLDATPRPPQPAVTARSTAVTAVAVLTEAGRRVSGPSTTDHIEE